MMRSTDDLLKTAMVKKLLIIGFFIPLISRKCGQQQLNLLSMARLFYVIRSGKHNSDASLRSVTLLDCQTALVV